LLMISSVPFLKEIAHLLYQSGDYDITETCILFPNKRARLYLSKYIGEISEKPVLAPRYLTINEMMEKLSGYFYADRWTLLFELFDVYSEVTGSKDSFDTFYPYSEALLADFDEIDKYLINAGDLFQNLAGLKSIDGRFNYLSDDQIRAIQRFWSTFDPEQISDGQNAFLSLWDALPDVYRKLKENLHNANMGYEGMVYRNAAEKIESGEVRDELEYQKYIIVGFNALNSCEERLFRYLKNSGKAEFFWDYDSWYMNSGIHEAGFFLRKNLKNFPQAKPVNHENLTSKKKRVVCIPVPSNTGQASVLPLVLNNTGDHDIRNSDGTVVVLADESLLIPVLYSIPGHINEVNVTMGYPLWGSAVFHLINSLYELIRNSKKGPDYSSSWHYKDVLAIISNPLLKNVYGDLHEKIRQKVTDQNKIYLSQEDISRYLPDDMIFSYKLTGSNLVEFLLEMTGDLIRRMPGTEEKSAFINSVNGEVLFRVYTFLTRLHDILTERSYSPEMVTLFSLLRKMMRTMHVPFNGEPLAGLQVMGLLETRTLDFEHVIILSANEGVLPRASESPSFIPRNLRVGFGLPAMEHNDAIYSYYFYRLIQRAENITLVYDNTSGGLRTGEPSRFIHQLRYEMNLPVEEITHVTGVSHIPVIPVIIEKKNEIADAILKYTGNNDKVLSPSAMNEFLNCSLRYYFHHIAGLPEPEEVSEEIDARMFGNILHKAMKLIYDGFGTSLVTAERLEALMKDDKAIYRALDKAINIELYHDKSGADNQRAEGYNLIIRQILRKYIHQHISAESKAGPFSIIGLESRYTALFPILVNGKPYQLRIGGIIDRIDNFKGRIRIIDYKTGQTKHGFSTIESLFDVGGNLRNDAVFQVLLYACIYKKLFPGSTIMPALAFVRDSHLNDYSFNILSGREVLDSYNSVSREFEDLLQVHLQKLFNMQEPFKQTENYKLCRYCPYNAICRREEIN
jgi:hypothetical protein